MSTFRNLDALETRPTADIFTVRPNPAKHGAITLIGGDTLGVWHDKGFYRRYKISSVAAYALEYNECPIKAVERAKSFGHPLHYIFALATCVSSSPAPRETIIAVKLGTLVYFQGRYFTIIPANNDNLALKVIDPATVDA